ncbi:hypothetical protein ABZX51_011069 [Aspergillus tubingensis]
MELKNSFYCYDEERYLFQGQVGLRTEGANLVDKGVTLAFRTELTRSGIISETAGAPAGLGDARHRSLRKNGSLTVQFEAGAFMDGSVMPSEPELSGSGSLPPVGVVADG